MSQGILLHAAYPFLPASAGVAFLWPADRDQSWLLYTVFAFIHVWRMPAFFLLSGFFTALVLARSTLPGFLGDRAKRIVIPLVILLPLVTLLIPPIWTYAWLGYLPEGMFHDVGAWFQLAGEPFAHLWFLYYLLWMYAVVTVMKVLRERWGLGLQKLEPLADAFYSRMPVLLTVSAIVLLIARAGNESKPMWPVNWLDLAYGGLFFAYGYGLFRRRSLIDGFTGWRLAGICLMGTGAFVAYLAYRGILANGTEWWLIETTLHGTSAVFLTVGLVGVFERVLNRPRAWVRWLADSSYWIYIIHIPVVAFTTFYVSQLDQSGTLRRLTGFDWSAELRFAIACVVTFAIGIVSYRYLVRYTPVGAFLNGVRFRSPRDSFKPVELVVIASTDK